MDLVTTEALEHRLNKRHNKRFVERIEKEKVVLNVEK